MDLISHTLTGVAVGTVVSAFSKHGAKDKTFIILLGGLGGLLPDLDAISLWSKFDTTLGSFFNLSHSGKTIYFGKFWYSHHAAMHSLFAALLLPALLTLLMCVRKRSFSKLTLQSFWHNHKLRYISFFLGFTFHLLEDMPTPASVWGGVNLFFPSSSYVGGYGKIWWWNNYDIFLLIVAVIVLNLTLSFLPKTYFKLKTFTALGIFGLGVVLAITQIMTRPVDFNYTGHTVDYAKYEIQSKEIQRAILGEKLYNIMEAFDNKVPLYF